MFENEKEKAVEKIGKFLADNAGDICEEIIERS